MKQKMFLFGLVLLLSLAFVVPSYAKPTVFTMPYNQAQFQWCALFSAIGDWSPGASYQNFATSSDFSLTGNVLHTSITYSPSVTDLQGASTVYVFDASTGLWIQHEGTISYTSPYSGLPITEYWRGYLKFSDVPSELTFVHGVGYQWGYVFLPESDSATVLATYPYATWDSTVGGWLLGFSIYLWDPTSFTQSYTTAFPSPFIEPVPANNFNPLGL